MEWQTKKTLNQEVGSKTEISENSNKIELINEPVQETVVPTQQENNFSETLIISTGQTLRTIALELFGSKEFWVYIYKENINNIKNPNDISVGTKLQIPDKSKYDINADNPQSVSKAKEEGMKILDNL